MKQLFLILVLISSIFAQIPFWVSTPPEGYENQYYVGDASASTQDVANKAAYANAIKQIEESRNGVKVVGAYTSIKEGALYENDKKTSSSLHLREEFSTEGVSGDTLYVTPVETCQFKSYKGGYRSFILVRVPRDQNIRRTPNAFTLGLRSTAIPGWAQVKKYEKGKAFLYFTGTAGLLASCIVFNGKSANSHEEAMLAKTRESIEFYNDQASTQMTISVSSLIGAGALWIGNIVSAVHKPEKVYR